MYAIWYCLSHMGGWYTARNTCAVKDKHLLNIYVSYNITPLHSVLIQTSTPTSMKWSYNNMWAKTPLNSINARWETISIKPSSKLVKRCLIIGDGWFEWLRTNNSEQPYFFHMNDELFFLLVSILNMTEWRAVQLLLEKQHCFCQKTTIGYQQ